MNRVRVLPVLVLLLGMPAAGLDDKVEIPGKIYTILPRDRIKAIKNPVYVSADEAEIPDEARVIAVRIGDESRAFDPNLLNFHEIVNDDVGGKKIAVAW